MKDNLIIECEPEDWMDKMDQMEKMKCELKAIKDPVFFWDHPAMGGQKLWDSQKELLTKFYSVGKDGRRLYNELLFDAGRKGGKTTFAALILGTELMRLLLLPNPQDHYNIMKGTNITLFMSAAGERQTLTTIFPRIRQLLENSPFFCSYADSVSVTSGKIRFPNHIILEAVGSNLKTAVGRTVKAFVAEEINSVGIDKGEISPAKLYNKLSKSTTEFIPFGEDIRVAISSKVSGYDFLSQRIAKTKESNLPRTLILQMNTIQLNPTITEEILLEDKERDEDSYNIEYGIGEALEGDRFFNPITWDRLKFTNNNIFTVPVNKSTDRFIPDLLLDNFKIDKEARSYMLLLDPSTIRDPFGIGVAHSTVNDEIVFDGLSVFRSNNKDEINPEDVDHLVMGIIDHIPIQYCVFDIYLYNELRKKIEEHSVEMVKNILNLSDWNQVKDQCNARSITVPKSDYLEREFKELIIKNGTRVDHPYNGSNDMVYVFAQGCTFPFRDRKDEKQISQLIAGVSCAYR